jgi:hypothetical protein
MDVIFGLEMLPCPGPDRHAAATSAGVGYELRWVRRSRGEGLLMVGQG